MLKIVCEHHLIVFLILFSLMISTSTVSGANTSQSMINTNLMDYSTNTVVSCTNPKNGELNVATNKVIKITFNKPVQIENGWVELKSCHGFTPVKKFVDGRTLILTPTSLLRGSTVYNVILHTDSLSDYDGHGITCYQTCFSTEVKVDIINHHTGGDIRKNPILTSYLPRTVLTNRILDNARHGTPMITFGDGYGPKVFIVAGVHGNELPANAAAMNLINYLNGKYVKGTIYIVPFAIPKTTSHNTRYWYGKDPNDLANIMGSPTNLMVKKAKKLGVHALGDFHSTQPGGRPGMDSSLCTMKPTFKSYLMAKYIAMKSGSTLIADRVAGKEYPGALEDVCNLMGIPSVTCEVLISKGKLTRSRVNKSILQMLAFLEYNRIHVY